MTGLAAGALTTTPLLGVFAVGWLVGIPFVPYTVFEWLIRVLPGSVVNFGLDLTLRVLAGLGLDIKDTAKTAEQVLAVASLFLAGLLIGLIFFGVVRSNNRRRVAGYGLAVGVVVGAFSTAVTWTQNQPSGWAGKLGFAVWTVVLFALWGWAMGRLRLFAYGADEAVPVTDTGLSEQTIAHPAGAESPPAEVAAPAVSARAMSRRRFLIDVGGLAATIVVVGAGVAAVLRAEAAGPDDTPATSATLADNDSTVVPAPGTRPEVTAVADHFRIDIDLTVPVIDEASWRLVIDGAVERPLSLSLDELRSRFERVDRYVTLSCIDNPVGGPFIDTTLWSGTPLRDVLAEAGPLADARYAHIYSEDGFDEQVELALVQSDPRIMLAYAWNNEPLPAKHGFPLRVLVPGRYGMTQPKWITRISLLSDSIPGYWVSRGWDEIAAVQTTSVIDTVAIKSAFTRDGVTYVPIGGIAYSGAKGISRVEILIDDGPWQAATLREPLSDLTWVLWRYDYAFTPGRHTLAVRCYDGEGRLQEAESRGASPSGATGLFDEYRDF